MDKEKKLLITTLTILFVLIGVFIYGLSIRDIVMMGMAFILLLPYLLVGAVYMVRD